MPKLELSEEDKDEMKLRHYHRVQSGEDTTTLRREHKKLIEALIEVGVKPIEIVAYLAEKYGLDVDF